MKSYTAPETPPVDEVPASSSVFLAGSIEMDKAEKWQDVVISKLEGYDVAVYNPRRERWDSSWVQEMANPVFAEQVNWELNHLCLADVKFFYFDPNTKSPITLMELGFVLGLFATKIVVVCPDGFWRKGNVEVICQRAGVKVLNDLNSGVRVLSEMLQNRSLQIDDVHPRNVV